MVVELAYTEFPAVEVETAPPLVIAHGLLGARKNWATLGKRLATNRRVFAVDLRNHGHSPWDQRHDYQAMAGDLAAFIDANAGGCADVMGHSMGGKAAMAAALAAPHSVRTLIVADIAPVVYAHSHEDFIEAMRRVDTGSLTRRKQAEPMIAAVVTDPGIRAFLLQNLASDEGRFYWRVNLEALAKNMSFISGWPSEFTAQSYGAPTLFIRGGASDYVQDHAWDGIKAQFPAATLETVAGAGHWLHAEKPEPFLQAVSAFLGKAG